ncbi:MAG TPA: hypothetical protein IAB47_04520 [Candidatus Scatomorpha merdigallinarum]|nr:hypothetical protein [Candidatus Scatomorpha merdigallinarum]
MSTDYGFSELENRLVEACKRCPPDMAAIEAILGEGADVNATAANSGENPLSAVILNYAAEPGMDSSTLPDIVEFFLKHGFDVARDEGRYGAMCLMNLIHSSNDDNILSAAKILLEAGANPAIPPVAGEEQNAIAWAYTEGAVAESVFQNYQLAGLLDGLGMVMESYTKE